MNNQNERVGSSEFSALTDTVAIEWQGYSLEPSLKDTLLFGRDTEQSRMKSAFERVKETQGAEVLVVHGCSGVGKTALVESLRGVVCESNGYFCSGKYNQNSALQEPYSAIMAAFSDLLDLVTQSQDFTEERLNYIKERLGSDVHLLGKAVSNLAPFIDEEHDAQPTSDLAVIKFKMACKKFLHAMSSDHEHPTVLFIDDIQWMDEGSRQLIKMFLRDEELANVMLIIAYRDEEAHLIEDVIDKEMSSREGIVDIPVGNLSLKDVTQLVESTLDTKTNDVSGLCELVEHKTKGNAFHAIQLVDVIQREGLLKFVPGQSRWEFDIEEIQRGVMVSDSLADLLVRRIRRLPTAVQETLKIAALIGHTFREDVLLQVTQLVAMARHVSGSSHCEANSSEISVAPTLSVALEHGFIEQTGRRYYFSHDKVQAAFQSMFAATEEKDRIHLLIGEAFLMKADTADCKYQAALHLNLAATLYIHDSSGSLKLALLNREAAMICQGKSAFEESAMFLRQALLLLGPNDQKWTNHFDLAFEITECLAKAELIIGNFEKCKEATCQAFEHGHTKEMKVIPLLVDVDRHMVGNDADGVIFAANRVLSVLGFKMPPRVSIRHLLFKLIKVRRRIGRMADSDILNLPRMQDPNTETAIRILVNQCLFCFLRDAGLQAMYSALFATELSMKYGLAPHSASAFAVYGVTEVSFGKHERGYRLGKLALQLLDRIRCRDAEGSTTGVTLTLLTHWKDPLSAMPKVLTRAANNCVAAGDIFFGTYCVSADFASRITLGKNLKDLCETMRVACRPIKELGHENMCRWVQPSMQFVDNLMSRGTDWLDKVNLTGEQMNETEYELYADENNHPVFLEIAWQYKAQLAYWFGQYSLSDSIYSAMAAMNTAVHITISYLPICFYAGMASLGAFTADGNRRHLTAARKYLKKLYKLVSMGSAHSAAFLSLFEAEYQCVRNLVATTTVVTLYTQAIHDTNAEQLVHLEALANERLGFYYANRGGPHAAAKHFDRAVHLYRHSWGATAKAEWLLEKSTEEVDKKSPLEQPKCFQPAPLVGEVIELRIPPHHSVQQVKAPQLS